VFGQNHELRLYTQNGLNGRVGDTEIIPFRTMLLCYHQFADWNGPLFAIRRDFDTSLVKPNTILIPPCVLLLITAHLHPQFFPSGRRVETNHILLEILLCLCFDELVETIVGQLRAQSHHSTRKRKVLIVLSDACQIKV
jgi:hypothetical protein